MRWTTASTPARSSGSVPCISSTSWRTARSRFSTRILATRRGTSCSASSNRSTSPRASQTWADGVRAGLAPAWCGAWRARDRFQSCGYRSCPRPLRTISRGRSRGSVPTYHGPDCTGRWTRPRPAKHGVPHARLRVRAKLVQTRFIAGTRTYSRTLLPQGQTS